MSHNGYHVIVATVSKNGGVYYSSDIAEGEEPKGAQPYPQLMSVAEDKVVGRSAHT
jgi:hypothetical protein